MPLATGVRLGPYEILSALGAGGMGEVYRATDTKLKREVAIKVLPDLVASDPERLARFQREAQVLAVLNHPNIAQIYGFEDVDALRHPVLDTRESSSPSALGVGVGPHASFLVMELVEGPTLAERLEEQRAEGGGQADVASGSSRPSGLPIEEALHIARQIADALEAAHEQGIIHRDLKPANIKLRPDGTVKILDFGLAKAVEPVSAASSMMSRSPTITTPAMTQAGIILGTAAYMAPEQARGRAVDKRADIWAFGVVLYEMVTGRRLFDGEDLTDTLARVVRDQVDVSTAPLAVRDVLERCLQKDPKKRLRDISGFALLIERPPEIPQQIEARATSSIWSAWAPWAVAAAAVAGVAALAFMHFREAPPELQAVGFGIEAPPDAALANIYGAVGVSPDGRSVVFAAGIKGVISLWVRPLDSLVARQLPGTTGGNFPTWSPDSRSLVFFADGKLKRIEIAGGAPLTLGDATLPSVTPTGSWNRAGVILFGSAAGLQRVLASGGGATPLTKVDRAKQETGHGYPQFLPDGKRFLYFVASADASVQGVYASALDSPGERQQILRTAAKAVYVPPRASYPGYLLWMQDQTLRAQRFDPALLKLEGDSVSVVEGVGLNPNDTVRAAFWASDTGLLAYFSGAALNKRALAWIDRDGRRVGAAAPDDLVNSLALAPGAQRLAVDRTLSAQAGLLNRDIWLLEFARGVMTRLTFDAGVDEFPVWSPDGRRVAFSSNRSGGVNQIYWKDVSGVGAEERLTEGLNAKIVLDWSKDGKYLLYREQSSETRRDLMVLPLEGDRKPIPLVATPFNESTGAISPDVRWVAYASEDSGRYEVYVQAFPGAGTGPAGRWQISTNGGYDVKWRGDGKEIYYQSLDGKMMALAVQTSPQGVRSETPRELFSADFTNFSLHQFDVTSDGQRFLLALNPSAANTADQRLMVVHNWQAALRK